MHAGLVEGQDTEACPAVIGDGDLNHCAATATATATVPTQSIRCVLLSVATRSSSGFRIGQVILVPECMQILLIMMHADVEQYSNE